MLIERARGLNPLHTFPAALSQTSSARFFDSLWGRCGHRPSVSKKSFRHAGRIFKLLKKFKNTCRLNAKGAFCPLHTSPAALSQTSSARFFDSLSPLRSQRGFCFRISWICLRAWRQIRPRSGPGCPDRWLFSAWTRRFLRPPHRWSFSTPRTTPCRPGPRSHGRPGPG